MAATAKYIHEDNLLIVLLKGRLDTMTAPTVQDEMEKEFTNEKNLVLDCKELEYISSAGLRLLLSWQKKIAKNSGTMSLINVGGNVCEILEVTGFNNYFNIHK
jgi:anti-sigma B factor antagonist